VFFVADADQASRRTLDIPLDDSWQFWQPSLLRVKPRGESLWPFGVWWTAHHFRLFQGREYTLLLRYDNEVLVHRSCIFPKFYRFPFMGERDLQVGDVWTAPTYRGRGTAVRALKEVLRRFPDRTVWYVCEESNVASIRVAERAGLRIAGFGTRTKRFGLRALGQFRMLSTEPSLGRSP
jgi:RimJ/RimL family protein N-acetyltransferase